MTTMADRCWCGQCWAFCTHSYCTPELSVESCKSVNNRPIEPDEHIPQSMNPVALSIIVSFGVVVGLVQAFTTQSTHTWTGIYKQVYSNNVVYPLPATMQARINHNTLQMRDASASYWFQVGDRVKVVDDVYKANINLLGRQGKVVETWEKCDVDPTW